MNSTGIHIPTVSRAATNTKSTDEDACEANSSITACGRVARTATYRAHATIVVNTPSHRRTPHSDVARRSPTHAMHRIVIGFINQLKPGTGRRCSSSLRESRLIGRRLFANESPKEALESVVRPGVFDFLVPLCFPLTNCRIASGF